MVRGRSLFVDAHQFFAPSRADLYSPGMNAITLPPDLEQYANDAVAAGRFRDVSEVVRAGISMLQRADSARAALLASVLAAQDEGDRDGYLTADDLMTRVEARLAAGARARG